MLPLPRILQRCALAFGLGAPAVPLAGTEPPPVIIGAHYYPWYTPRRWQYQECYQGTLRRELLPAQQPLLGPYDSADPQVIERHLAWCSEYNIGMLILEFYGSGTSADRICREQILAHPHAASTQFTVLYDWAIRFGGFEVTAERLATVRSDFRHLAQHYLSHPAYLRAPDNRPVVFLYVTRALQGDVNAFIRAMREATLERGIDPFLVGDEFFFLGSPQSAKIARWDGIFGYDVYGSRGGYWGPSGTLSYFTDRAAAYHRNASQSGVAFFPSIMPGFNDRAVRRTCADNPAAARRLAPDADPLSLFRAMLDHMLASELDPAFPMVCITSFNEWHEDTQIEPTAGTGPTTGADTSSSGSQYTQELPYDDYGFGYLELIRDRTVAVAGLVRQGSRVIPNARVTVAAGLQALAPVRTDSFGRFKVMRSQLPDREGTVALQAIDEEHGRSPVVTCTLDPAHTVASDLELIPAQSRIELSRLAASTRPEPRAQP